MRRWLPGIGRRAPKVPARELPDDQLRVTWQAVSLLLDYPSVKLFRNLTRLRDVPDGCLLRWASRCSG